MEENRHPTVFVITPFGEDFLALFAEFQNRFGEKFIFTNAGDLDNQQNVLKDIVEGIATADVIIADLTGLNANVFYELGLAHAMNKKVIIITQAIDDLPIDIRSYRANQYSLLFHKLPQLMVEIEKLLDGALDGSIKFGNPVSDYAPTASDDTTNDRSSEILLTNPVEIVDDENEGKGFLDYIAEISDNSLKMQETLTLMADETTGVGKSIAAATDDIDRVSFQSGKADPVYARNVCRKLAKPMEEYAEKIKGYVGTVSTCWNNIENDYLGLLENQHMRTKDNITDLQQSEESLIELQATVHESDESVERFISILKKSTGMERRLTRAITLTINELEAYLTLTSTMSSSIDRIRSKSAITITAIVEDTKED